MMSMPNDARLDDLVEAIKTLLASQGRIYMHFAKATIERFGRDGEMTVRLGLRAYGQWRGGEMRAAHHALGKDINMATLIGCWDNASTYVIKDDMDESGTFEPCNVASTCPTARPPRRGRTPSSSSGATSTATSSTRPAPRPTTRTATWSSRRT